MPLLGTPKTATRIFPVAASVGTTAMICVSAQLVMLAGVPLNVTVLVPCVAPKFVPVIVTAVPVGPDVGLTPLMLGVGAGTFHVPIVASPTSRPAQSTASIVMLCGPAYAG